MTVNILVENTKDHLCYDYEQGNLNISLLAKKYKVSERTVSRVLKERNVPLRSAKQSSEANEVMNMLKKYEVDLPTLQKLLVFHKDGPSRAQVVKYMVDASEQLCSEVQSEYIKARVAKEFNRSVQASMLSISNKVQSNAKQ